jgi:hypothetical protein
MSIEDAILLTRKSKIKNLGLSLSDQYWINPKHDQKQWADVNFFTNKFSNDLGDILIGNSDNKHIKKSLMLKSPDATTQGNLQKRWKIINGKRYLIKKGSSSLDQSIFNEKIVSDIGKSIFSKGDFVTYDLFSSDEKDGIYCKCKNMITENDELVPAVHYTSNIPQSMKNILDSVAIKNKAELEIQISKMFLLDVLIRNEDRHMNNFGFIRDVNTLEIKRLAPIFDNGISLYSSVEPYKEIEKYVVKPKIFNSFEQLLKVIKDLSWLNIDKDYILDCINKTLHSYNFDKLYSKKIDNILKLTAKNISEIRNYQLGLEKQKRTVFTNIPKLQKSNTKNNEGSHPNGSKCKATKRRCPYL